MIPVDSLSDVPLYRQLFDHFVQKIDSGSLIAGEKLPATRELAGQLGLNRTTVSAAYELLEAEGWISGEVGRGSFVRSRASTSRRSELDWSGILDRRPAPARHASGGSPEFNFSNSRPSEQLFPLGAFRESAEAVLASTELPAILQLGSPGGYEPLRQHLIAESEREGVLRAGDDLVITNGCQQALDLLRKVLIRPGDIVALEDPVYPGLRNLFQQGGATVAGLPVGREGIAPEDLAAARAKLAVITPNFQNPTGASLPLASREALLRVSQTILVENDIYSPLRYSGTSQTTLKQLDETGDLVLLRSFSKIAFPGLRVGWVIGPRPLIQRLMEAKALADLHTDHFSQAVLLEFSRSGRLAAHQEAMLRAGALRLEAVLAACARWLPAGCRYTRPEGGMNLWIELPESLDAGELLPVALSRGVAYWPGKYFAVTSGHANGLRLSFAGLREDQIAAGVQVLGTLFAEELEAERSRDREPVPAMV